MEFNQKTDAILSFTVAKRIKKEVGIKKFDELIKENVKAIEMRARLKFSFAFAKWELEDNEYFPFLRYHYVIFNPTENPKQF